MADEKVIMPLTLENLAAELWFVAMHDGEQLAGEFELAEVAEALHADVARIALQAGAVEIVVAEDKRGAQASEMVENFFRTDVAAVDEKLCALASKELHGGRRHRGAVMRVAEDADDHEADYSSPREFGSLASGARADGGERVLRAVVSSDGSSLTVPVAETRRSDTGLQSHQRRRSAFHPIGLSSVDHVDDGQRVL